ncbi:MAG: hypothetical protein CVV12_11685 [Gammaproteobacteria bacterium HGW-Gammaproteobacteria-2]|jgi:hypothetical protein|nr:MAG: hypothetical protein CVV12_11685 [Gammaproteobacteria bacterium HGW-Gammaproteobacteria-2]
MWHENAMLSSQRPAQLQSKALTGLRPARPSPGGKGPDALRWYARQCGSSRTDPLRIWATVGRRRTRTSMCSVASRQRLLRRLCLRIAAARLARSNTGAFPLRLSALLAVFYGALLHSNELGNCSCAAQPMDGGERLPLGCGAELSRH